MLRSAVHNCLTRRFPFTTLFYLRVLIQDICEMYVSNIQSRSPYIITKEYFQYYWKRVKERTASSYSGRHFGHYKSAAHSDYLSEVHARHLALITKTGATPSRWSKGLSVILELRTWESQVKIHIVKRP